VTGVQTCALPIYNSLTFDGFHYDNPLEIYAELHYKFRY
jgi:hypothetical protein